MSLGKLKSNNKIEKLTMMDQSSSISTSASISADGLYPIVRRRISKACNYCRQRKIKCNGNTPCLNCKNHQIECTYSKTIRKKKKQTTKKLTLQDLEKRMNKMDQKFDFLNEQMTSILTILSENKLNIKSKSSDHNNNSSKSGKVKHEHLEETSELVTSEEEEEDEEEEEEEMDEDEYEDEDDQQGQDLDDDELTSQLAEDQHHNYLSPLSNISNNESISSTSDSNDFNYNYNATNTPGLNNFTNSQIADANLIPIGGSTSGYALDQQAMGSVPQFGGINGSAQVGNGNGAFDFGGLDNKLNYLYSDVPLMSQMDQNDVFN